MKNKVKSTFLIMIIIVQLFSTNIFAATEEEIYTGNQLSILGILKGYTDGSLQLDNNILRSEVATLTVRILGYEDTIVVGNEKKFTDVTTKHWAYNNIQNAFKLNIIQGYPTGEFKPQSNITYAEVVAIMVNALGKGKDIEGKWPDNYLNKGKDLGVIPKNSTVNPDKVVTRGEMAVIVWNTLLVKQ